MNSAFFSRDNFLTHKEEKTVWTLKSACSSSVLLSRCLLFPVGVLTNKILPGVYIMIKLPNVLDILTPAIRCHQFYIKPIRCIASYTELCTSQTNYTIINLAQFIFRRNTETRLMISCNLSQKDETGLHDITTDRNSVFGRESRKL